MEINVENLKVIIHGVDVTDKVESLELRAYGFAVKYIDGKVGTFNRADMKIIDATGKDVSSAKELK